MASDDPVRVLFVCLGNICRSPLAEGVFAGMVRNAGLETRFEIDSAGTSAWHVGEPPDPRSSAEALRRGVRLEGRARRITASDLRRFDYVLAMDGSNLEELQGLTGDGAHARIELLRRYDPDANGGDLDVPDPYFGGERGFERVHDLVERACAGLLRQICEERGL